jgi:cysteine desulfurase
VADPGGARPLYLDHNASTPILPEVLDAMMPYLREEFGNPSSRHAYGRVAREAVERAREAVASFIGAAPSELVFTSGGTESNNLAIFGASAARPYRHHVVTTSVEHPAVRVPLARLTRDGASVEVLPVGPTGRIRDDAADVIGESTLLVTVMMANNETGAVQPVAALGARAEKVGALLHVDASQAMGKLPIDVRALNVSLLTLAGHKMYAPKGVGALFIRAGSMIAPRLLGAGHERGLRPGTENVAGIVGLGAAARVLGQDLVEEAARQLALTRRLFELLRERVQGLVLQGPGLEDPLRLPNTLSVSFPHVWGAAVLDHAPEVAASTGAACHDGRDAPSPGILALGIPEELARGTVRLSLGRGTTLDAVERAAEALARGWEAAREP